jgi:lipid A 3-O-deacylase
MRVSTPLIPTLLLLTLLPVPGAGQGAAKASTAGDESGALLRVGIGGADGTDRNGGAAALEISWRGVDPWVWRLRPEAGALTDSEGALYAYGGVHLPVELFPRLTLDASFGVGTYHSGHGVDLGSVLQFRSGAGLGWRVVGAHRLTIEIFHLSNAGIGRRNPGVEVLSIGVSVPL